MTRNDLHRSFSRAESALRTLGEMMLENPEDEVIEARYELALRTYGDLARKVEGEARAESVEVPEESAVQYGFRKLVNEWMRDLANN